jgi:pectate lyase
MGDTASDPASPADAQDIGAGGSGAADASEVGTEGVAGAGPGPGMNTVPIPMNGPIGFASLNGGTRGGAGGEVVTASSYDELLSFASGGDPRIIMVEGTIDNGSGGGVIRVGSNKSILGVGATAFLDRVVISIEGESNIIIHNLRITLVGHSEPTSINDGDAISISGSSTNIWIDHCELHSEDPALQTDIDFYDGLIDIKNSSGYITISWNYAHDHHKGFLVGSSASDLYDERKITYHHNHFARVRKRTPTYRGAVGHVFNNYVSEADQATFAMTGTCLRVERNFYENQVEKKYSIFTNDVEPGEAEVIDNFIAGGNNRDFPPPCTADIPYSYADVLIENAEDVKTVVIAGAGVGKL